MKFPLLAVAVLIGATACAATPSSLQQAPVGSARLVMGLQDHRQIQYTLTGDVKAIKVTVTEATNGQVASATFSGADLQSHLSGQNFSFTVNNLVVGDLAHPAFSYTAVVQAYLDPGATAANVIGGSTSSAFSVLSGQTSSINLPSLSLAATPLGSGTGTVTVVDNAPAAVTIN